MSTPGTTAPADPLPPTAAPRLWRGGLVAAVVAAVANTLVWLIGGLTSAGWEVEQAGTTTEVPWFAPAAASVVAVAVGTLALRVLRRFSWGLLVWTVAAVVVALGTVVSPLQAATDAWTGALLALMHVIALVVALLVLRPAARVAWVGPSASGRPRQTSKRSSTNTSLPGSAVSKA